MDDKTTTATTPTQTILDVTNNVLKYAPIASAAAQAIESSTLTGEDKQTAVVNTILAGAAAGEQSADVNVKTVSTLVDFVVSLLNMAGIFKHGK
jgi:hypothetical protein